MIRVMTLAAGDPPDHAADRGQKCTTPLRHIPIDILCCQSIKHSMDGNEDIPGTLARSLGLTCSSFAASRLRQGQQDEQGKGISGLAIMTGSGVWVLNSGSFSVPDDQEEGEEGVVQFALVRKNCASVLVLNLQFAASASTQQVQLHALFSHQLLKERYGAVVLCADRHTALPGKMLQAITASSNYGLHRCFLPAQPCTGKGMMCLFVLGKQATADVTIDRVNVVQASGAHPFTQPGLTIEFEMQRIARDLKIRPYLPLSFREQWLGGREKYPAFAA